MSKNKSWTIHDSMSIVIQLKGMSEIYINKSTQQYFLQNVDGDVTNHFKENTNHTKLSELGFKSIADIMFDYDPPKKEVRIPVTIYPGQMLVCLSSLPYGEMGCLNLDNDRAHVIVPIKNMLFNTDSVTLVRSNSRVQSSFFQPGLARINNK